MTARPTLTPHTARAVSLLTALVATSAASASSPLDALECDPVDEWVAAGPAPTVRPIANHHGWTAFEAVRGADRRFILSHPPDDGAGGMPPWGNLDAPAEGACYLFKDAKKVKAPKPGTFGPPGGTYSVRVLADESCNDESCAWLLVGVDAKGVATSTVVVTSAITRLERVSVFGETATGRTKAPDPKRGHDSLLLTAETDAGAGYRHVVQALVHDSGQGLAPLVVAELGVHEELAPSERAENRDLRCWRRPAGWLRVETRGAAPVIDVLEPIGDSEDGEGLGTGRRTRWVWSQAQSAFTKAEESKLPYDARAACRRGRGSKAR